MSLTLADRVSRLEGDFLDALRKGPAAVSAFNSAYGNLRCELERAHEAGALPNDIRDLACATVASIMDHARIAHTFDTSFDDIVSSEFSHDVDSLDDASQPTTVALLPLFRYFLSAICHPYPEAEEKERIAEQVREAGWHDFDKRKVEDWLNRKRNQSGFVAILHRYCNNDREAMQCLLKTALFGSAEEKARLPDGAVEDVEEMRDYVQLQHDDIVEESDSTWVDDLACGVRSILGDRAFTQRPSSEPSPLADDESDDTYSNSGSESSETDVESDDDDEEDPARPIIGAKRKLTDSSDFSPPLVSRPLCRSLSMASSTSSSSSSTACSLRSFSGSSMSSVTTVEDEDDICDRPTKRSRPNSCDPTPKLSLSACSPQVASPTTPANPLFTQYQRQRKRVDGRLNSHMRSAKRSRYASLGVASQAHDVADAHLVSLAELCSLDWTPVEVVVRTLDADSYTVDGTQLDEEPEDEDFAIFSDREVEKSAHDILTWWKLQTSAMLRMLLSTSDRPLPTSLAQSATYAFDIEHVGADTVIALEEMMKFTPEALSAMFDAMNGVTPGLSDGTSGPAERTAAASQEEAILPLDAPVSTQAVSVLAPDVPAPEPAAPGVADDVSLSAVMDIPVLSIDASIPPLEDPTTASEQSLSPPDESPSPTSPTSSEGDSLPALSDDSGSSSRCSSPEPDSEPDSLLTSPAALSSDYGRLNDELSALKVSYADPSQFQVEYGAVPGATTADELACASELLERYLHDPMTWA